MDTKIQVLVDIYPNRFPKKFRYVYDNIRAVNPSEQAIVDKGIEQMMAGNNKGLLLESDETIWCSNVPYKPCREGRKCLFNITQQKFEF